MKKIILLGFISVTTLSIPSNVMGSSVTDLLNKAFPQSIFTTKCTASNAKINWNLVAQAEKNGGAKAIQQKVQDRVTPCLSANNPKYQKEFHENCTAESASSAAKTQVCAGGNALIQQQANPFGMQAFAPVPEQQAVPVQEPAMSTPITIQALETDIQALKAQIQALEAQIQTMATNAQAPDAKIQEIETQIQTMTANAQAPDAKIQEIETQIQAITQNTAQNMEFVKRLYTYIQQLAPRIQKALYALNIR